jgi:hypothetical protein
MAGVAARPGKEFPGPHLLFDLLAVVLVCPLRSRFQASAENRQKKEGVSREFIPLTLSPAPDTCL